MTLFAGWNELGGDLRKVRELGRRALSEIDALDSRSDGPVD